MWQSLLHMLFPSFCLGCGVQDVDEQEMICLNCQLSLPYTSFESIRNNAVEKIFWGRVPLRFASSTFYYEEQSIIQQIIHNIKYKDERVLAIHMGQIMGGRLHDMLMSNAIDCCIPMPLHPRKERQRGYNQASLLCEGIRLASGIPFLEHVLERMVHTQTQTKRSRAERWDNVADVFEISNVKSIQKKNIVLVDDVITTGASTEACARTLLEHGAANISVVSLAFTA